MLWTLLLACMSRCGEAPAPAPDATVTPAHQPEGPAAAPAPTRAIWGLELGSADEGQVQAWIAERGLGCDYAPSPRRTTTQWRCKGPIDLAKFPDRPIRGAIDQLVLARLDDGPLHYIALERVYSIPDQAVEDFQATLAAISATLGAPEKSRPLPEGVNWSAPMVHGNARWRFSDLEVQVSVLKVGEAPIRVSERWSQPGAEARAVARPGSAPVHGGGAPEAAKNPHEL